MNRRLITGVILMIATIIAMVLIYADKAKRMRNLEQPNSSLYTETICGGKPLLNESTTIKVFSMNDCARSERLF